MNNNVIEKTHFCGTMFPFDDHSDLLTLAFDRIVTVILIAQLHREI
jgi:hypothetical protein